MEMMDFTWMIFGAVGLLYCIHTASSAPYLSIISNGYMSIESGSPFFTCFRSNNAVNVITGRYVTTYFGGQSEPGNDPPPPSTPIYVGNPPTAVYRTNLSTNSRSSYGVFYCALTSQVGRTVVPTIFIRSDAKFVPSNGRFSKTVNKGDTNVTIDFTELRPSNLEKNWLFNGTTDPYEIGIRQFSRQSTNLNLEEADTSHAGVYEVFLGGERGEARAGLLRLIVRACPAGRYNSSNGCMEICPPCYNGGICHDETGKCVCPPGFRGMFCETACGGNRHGRTCEYRCDYNTDNKTACSGLQVCVPDPYGCSCTAGYKGLDCTTECDRGEFGASCTETCHCVSGECDRFTGVCTGPSTECQPGWIGVNCQVQTRFTSGLIVSRTTNESVTLRWGAWNASRDIGSPPLQYRVFYRQTKLGSFQRFFRSDRLELSETVTGLNADTDYVFGVEAAIPELKRIEKRLEILGSTKCSAPDGVPVAMTASPSTYLRTIQVNWQNSQLEANCRSGYTGVRIYWDAVGSSSNSSGSVVVPLNASMGYNLTAVLEPYTRYRVSAAMMNRDAEGPRCEPSEAMTAEEKAPPPSEIQFMSGSSFLVLKWNGSTPVHLNGDVRGYTINYTRVNPPAKDRYSVFIKTCRVINNIYLIEGVREGEKYEVQINTVNGVGSSEWSAKTTFEIVGGGGFSLGTVLLGSIIPSAIALACIIALLSLIVRRRASDDRFSKAEDIKNTGSATKSHATNVSEEVYETVSDGKQAYHDLELTSVKPDERYMTMRTEEETYQNIK